RLDRRSALALCELLHEAVLALQGAAVERARGRTAREETVERPSGATLCDRLGASSTSFLLFACHFILRLATARVLSASNEGVNSRASLYVRFVLARKVSAATAKPFGRTERTTEADRAGPALRVGAASRNPEHRLSSSRSGA